MLLLPPHSSIRPATWFLPLLLVPLGVGNEPEPVTSMRRTCGTRRQNRRPNGVADAFQVLANSIEPTVSNSVRNLLSKKTLEGGTRG